MIETVHLNLIKQKWKEIEEKPGIFQYNLHVSNRKCVGEKHKFYIELNPERSRLRRIPQVITSLYQNFDHNKFNFNKIGQNEKILDMFFEDTLVTFIINQSPLTPYHSLICPDLQKCQPQIITEKSLEFCVKLLLTADDPCFRIGYNSPGALASVNHLHFHLMYIDYDLYIDNVILQRIGERDVYRLHSEMPTEAICFLITDINQKAVVNQICGVIKFLCNQNIPHNVFITPDKTQTTKRLKFFIYARAKHCCIKDLTTFNVAFCEFSGYIPVGDYTLFERLTEAEIIGKIKHETGGVYDLIYKHLNQN